MTVAAAERLDVVYTWVDGAWPGYAELLRHYANGRHDLNPNRYRDNLSVLKYSLRSFERFAPWIGDVHLVTCRPQVPAWLDTRRVHVVHHDEFFVAGDLPTFNSFAIVANLHRIAGVSRRFLYVSDDYLLGAPMTGSDLLDDRGRLLLFAKFARTPPARRQHATNQSPWNAALAYSNGLLDARYGRQRRRMIDHTPLVIDRDRWSEMIAIWPDAFRQTSASRFRSRYNIAPEYLYPYYLHHESAATFVPRRRAIRQSAYHPLANVLPLQWIGLWRLGWQHATFFCLNDDFGERPNPSSVALAQRYLERWFPTPSRFERTGIV